MAEIGRNFWKAYDAGYAAKFHFKMAINANPYARENMKQAWRDGWIDAERCEAVNEKVGTVK